jgi:hypothetical protein
MLWSRADYPALYLAASDKSRHGRNRFIRATAIRLIALITAAIGGAASWQVRGSDVFGWIGLISFLTAIGVESYILSTHPERDWYEGRAAAESVKTLTWRYVVGSSPFDLTLPSDDVDKLFLRRLNEVLTDLGRLAIPPARPGGQITSQMRQVRALPYKERKIAYAKERVQKQRDWYGKKAKENDRKAHTLLLLTLMFELGGVIGAALKAFGVLQVDLLGIVAAGASGLAAWSQTRQYWSNARAYSVATHELASIDSEIGGVQEADWSQFVNDAEEAISREHTLWRASKAASSAQF